MPDQTYLPSSRALIEPGIYLDLDMQAYVDDPAISGSGLKKLLTSPADFKWELPGRNPLYTPPQSDARTLGTLVHCAVLEGMGAFEDRYFVAPELDDDDPRVIRTADHARAWLKDRDQPSSGLKAALFERVQAYWNVQKLTGGADDADAPIFLDELVRELSTRGNGRRQQVKRRDAEYVAQVERVVRSWPEARELLSGGLAEISIFWVEGGIRFKARLDYLTAAAVVDVKKFGQPPRRGLSLRTFLCREAVGYGYDIQAVHNRRAAMQLPLLLQQPGAAVHAVGSTSTARIELVERIAAEILKEPPAFNWLFLRTPGPPQGVIMNFDPDSRRWGHCESDIEAALSNLATYREKCGDELSLEEPWIEIGVADFDDDDLPEYTWEIAR